MANLFCVAPFSVSCAQNASLSSTVWPDPHAIVPCLSWTTAATVFTTVSGWGVGEECLGVLCCGVGVGVGGVKRGRENY